MANEQSGSVQIQRLDAESADFQKALAQLQKKLSVDGDIVSEAGRQKTIAAFGEPLSPKQVVQRICQSVRSDGIKSLLNFTRQFDNVELNENSIKVSHQQLQDAHEQVDNQYLDCIRTIRDNIRHFQTAILHQDTTVRREPGIKLTQRYTPLKRIGICVPGGAAAYPSSLLMTVVPAQVAGVQEIAVVAPPTKFGAKNPHLLAACYELGIKEVYQVGGAQAVAALAYGVEGINRVHKIVGPGNLFVALAKQLVYGDVDIDSIAGPSEVVVIADEQANPKWVALDLLAQAEHSPGSSILITWSQELIGQVDDAIREIAPTLPRGDLALESLGEFGRLIKVRDREQAIEVTNQLAPEHLQVATDDANEMAKSLTNAGAIFVGHITTVALGDYVAGPSHVLPTGATAVWANGLSANDFLRSSSLIEYDLPSLKQDSRAVKTIAEIEGLTAHSESVLRRISEPD